MIFIAIIAGIIIFLASAVPKISAPDRKGRAGERIVSSIIGRLPKDKYIVLNDLMLCTPRGTSQIDHVIFSVFGIFVIETKNYSGWIYGFDNSEEWIESVYGKKFHFRNPLKQNYAHIKALQEVLEVRSQKLFISIVAFSNSAALKVQSAQNVVQFWNLEDCIKSYATEVISFGECKSFAERLEGSAGCTKRQKKVHVRKIKYAVMERERKIMDGICPKCGGRLVVRDGKFGKFRGCSSYPKCRFTHDL